MRGLLYKEWLAGRKSFVLFFVISAIFSILGILVFLSMICGNLKNMVENDPDIVNMFGRIFMYVPYILLLLSAEGCVGNVYADYKSGWHTYSYTMPMGTKKLVGAKYIMTLCVYGIAFLAGLLNSAIIVLMSDVKFTMEVLEKYAGNTAGDMSASSLYNAIGIQM